MINNPSGLSLPSGHSLTYSDKPKLHTLKKGEVQCGIDTKIESEKPKIQSVAAEIIYPGLPAVTQPEINPQSLQKQFIEEKYPYLADVEPDDLQKIWQKSCKIFLKTFEKLRSYNCCGSEGEQAEFKKIQQELEVWSLHYLTTGARKPVLYPKQPQHLPFLEFQRNNLPEYYRGDGGVIIDLYREKLRTISPFQEFAAVEPVKNRNFNFFIKTCCESSGYEYRSLEDDSRKINSKSLFFDATLNLEKCKDDPAKALECLKNLHQEFKPNTSISVGGILYYKGQEIFICYPESRLSQDVTNDIKDSLGSSGFYPDIIVLKHRLLDLDWNFREFLSDRYPFCDSLNLKNKETKAFEKEVVLKKLQELREKTEKIISETENGLELTRLYLQIVQNLLAGISNNFRLDQEIFYEIVDKQIERIDKRLEKIKTTDKSDAENKFITILQEFTLIFEAISGLSILFKNQMPPLKNILQNLPPNFNEAAGVEKFSFIFTSGTAAINAVTNALYRYDPEKKQKVIFNENCYYELFEKGGLEETLSEKFNVLNLSLGTYELKNELKDTDIFFTDLHPNKITSHEVHSVNIKDLIKSGMSERTEKNPFTLVLDTSTTLFYHPEVVKIIEDPEIKSFIEKGLLCVIEVASLAKFSMAGLDKQMAGSAQVFVKKESQFFEEVISLIQQRSHRDPLSNDTENFFSLFLQQCSSIIIQYFERIKENTHAFYTLLEKHKLIFPSENPIQIGQRDENIVMLGLHFSYIVDKLYKDTLGDVPLSALGKSESEDGNDQKKSFDEENECMTFLMQFYLYALCVDQGLPISISSSFGFPRTTLIECSMALRMVLGLEDENMRNKYLEIILSINNEIKNNLENLSNESKLKLQTILKNEELQQWVEEHQVMVVQKAIQAKGNFIEFLNSISDIQSNQTTASSSM